MKKFLATLTVLFCFFQQGISQEIHYGFIAGPSVLDLEIEGPLSAGNTYTIANIGGFLDIPFTERLGLKSHILYQTKSVTDFTFNNSVTSNSFKLENASVVVQPLVKYDVKDSYNNGFYLLGGPRASFTLSTDLLDGETRQEVDDFYNESHFGVNLGLGFTFLKHFGFEIIGDYGISEFVNSDNEKNQTVGFYANLEINLASILAN